VFGNEKLTLVGYDCSKLWEKAARKRIRSGDDSTGDYCSSVGYYAVLAVTVRNDVSHSRSRVQSNA
jgi:hypothetical protein